MKFFNFFLTILLILPIILATPFASAAEPNLITNPSFEQNFTNWTTDKWGQNTVQYKIITSNAQNGTKSGKVTISSYTSGDARLGFKAVTVEPNTQYDISLAYKSNISTTVFVDAVNNSNIHSYIAIGSLPSSTSWKNFTTKFTMPSDIKNVQFYAAISQVGFIQTDNYSITKANVQPPIVSNKFARPLISIDFDDGWVSAYSNGFPILNEFGFKGTAGIITKTVESIDQYDISNYINLTKIQNLITQGHKIASHSFSHADLTTASIAELTNEVVTSKKYLESKIGKSINYFITPYCGFNSTVTSLVKQNYNLGMRNCDSITNNKLSFDRYNIGSFPILSTTTDAQIQTAINDAKANNQWLIFMYHKVDNSAEQYSVTPSKLRQHMQFIKDSTLTVKPSEDAISEIISQL